MGSERDSAETMRSDLRFRRLFDEHRLDVLAYCMRRARRWDAFDAAAETFAIAWRRREDMPGEVDALPWLYGVARRVLANMRRSEARRQRLHDRLAAHDPAGDETPEILVVRRDRDRWVIDAALRLPENDREILFLTAWEGLSHSESGRVLGLTEEASRKRLERARRRLARELRKSQPGRAAAVGGEW